MKHKKPENNADTACGVTQQDIFRIRISEPLGKLGKNMFEMLNDLFEPLDDIVVEPDMDLFETEEKLVAEFVIPGVDKSDLTLKVSSDEIFLHGEILASEDYEEYDAMIAERFYGNFKRTVPLPYKVNPSQTEAFYREGILRVEMPIEEEGEYLEMDIQIL